MPRYLVTSALPYANGPIHFGHAVGAYLPADVYVRALRSRGEEVLYVCGTDEHGVAITIGAEAAHEPYPDYVARWRAEIKRTFDRLGIEFDVWSGTSISPCHAELSREFFRRLSAGGYLIRRSSEQLYSVGEGRFLADRYVIGTCPKCGHDPARGDECPACGSWLEVLDLGNPRSKVSGEQLTRRPTVHWYLDLPKLVREGVDAWFHSNPEWKPNVAAFVERQLAEVEPRPITRDLPWGVPVPEEIAGDERGKVLYVWFDAPIGYISFTREWAERQGRPEAWRDYWQDPETRLVHFIGKDNIPFHCVVFPAMLFGVKQGYVLPWRVPANEFYNLEGRKFSTSGGWYLPLDELFERFDPEAARFYLIASMPETADSEWRWEDFQRSTAILADALGNLATRVLKFIEKHFDGRIPPLTDAHRAELDESLLARSGAIQDPIEELLAFRFRRAAECLIGNATAANVFVDREAPWSLRKSDPERCASVLNTCCEWLALLARWMVPFLPSKAERLWAMLGQPGSAKERGAPVLAAGGAWRSLAAGARLGTVTGLFEKIPDEVVQAEIQALRTRARE